MGPRDGVDDLRGLATALHGALELDDRFPELALPCQGGHVTDMTHDNLFHYACTFWHYHPGEFLRSEDGGETWSLLTGHGQDCMTAMAVSPRWELFLAGNNGVMSSNNHGVSWKDITGDLPVGDMVHGLAIQYSQDPWPEIDLFATYR